MSFTTVPGAGQKLRGSVLSSLITEVRPVSAIVSGDQSLATSNTTLQNITDLAIAVVANATYAIDLHIMATLSSGVAEDLKIAATFPTGAVLHNLVALGGTPAGVATFVASDMFVGANGGASTTSGSAYATYGLSTSNTGSVNPLLLIMSSTAGTFQVQAAQNTSGANTVKILKGSLLVARRLS